MDQKTKLTQAFKKEQAKYHLKHQCMDDMIEQEAFLPLNRCIKSHDTSVVDGMPTAVSCLSCYTTLE
jgi:hypothetical protein